MRRSAQAHVLSSLAVMVYVAAPAVIVLTAQETVRIDRLAYMAAGDVTASRHGDLLRPGTSTVSLDAGTYHFRTAGDAQLQVTDPQKVTVVTTRSEKDLPPPPVTQPGAGLRGGGMPDHVPSLTITYGDAA